MLITNSSNLKGAVMKDKTCWHHDVCIIKTPCGGCLEHSKINQIERCRKIAQQIIDKNLKIYNDRIKDLRDGITPGVYDTTVNAIKRLDLYYNSDSISER
jgi:hypothetical protein